MEKQPNSSMCFVCGRDNPIGFQMQFFADEQGRVHAECTPRAEHQSFPGVMHGGLVSALLDEIIGRTAIASNQWCMTAEFRIRYKKPVPIGEPITLVGELVRQESRVLYGHGEVRGADDDTLLAEADAVYIRLPDAQRQKYESALEGWRVD